VYYYTQYRKTHPKNESLKSRASVAVIEREQDSFFLVVAMQTNKLTVRRIEIRIKAPIWRVLTAVETAETTQASNH
jgi:hypothetical protein